MKQLRIAIAGAIIGRRHMERDRKIRRAFVCWQIRDVGYPDAVWRGELG